MAADVLGMEFTAGKQAGQRIVRVWGPLNSTYSETFLERIRHELDPVVIIDMHEVYTVDSRGIGALMFVHTTFAREQRRLALVGLTQRVREPMSIAQVLRFFRVFNTVEEAEVGLAAVGS